MHRDKVWFAPSLLCAATLLSSASAARAEFDACGGIFVSGSAKCEYREKESCMTQCKSETVETACSAKLYVSCEKECTASASTSCESSCSQVCTTDCTQEAAQAEPPNCMGLCVSDCQKTCENGGRGPRGACCHHNCNKRCEEKCDGRDDPVAKPAECTQTCMNVCSGSCTAQANVQCQLDCQTDVYTECETETIKTCETKCKDEGGAIFCDGQFVNAKSARSCADELKAKLDFDIDIKGTVTSVANDAAEATTDTYHKTKKKTKELCSVGPVGASAGAGLGGASIFGLCAATLAFLRARRRR